MESSNKRLIQTWLDLQCTMVQGAMRGAVFVGSGNSGSVDPVAVWPAETMLTAPMLSAAHLSLGEQRQVVEALALAAGSDITVGCDVIATPLVVDNESIGVVVMEVTARMKQRQDAAMQVLSWGGKWLETVVDHLNTGPNLRLSIVIETIADAVKHEAFETAAAAVASALSRLVECTRVSIGITDAGSTSVVAISNTARFEKRTNLVRSVAAAMDEAIAQDQSIALPAASTSSLVLTRANERHQSEFGAGEVYTIPFSNENAIVGAVVVERNQEQPLNREDVALVETIISIVGPILHTKRHAQLPLDKRLGVAVRDLLRRYSEPGHTTLKSVTASALIVLLAILFIPVNYAVTADANLLGEVQRAIIAPYDGYVAEAPLRAGDTVAATTLMAQLDDRDLRLELAKWRGEEAEALKSRQEAIAQHDRAKVAVLGAQIDQARASRALAEEKLSRAQVRAPIAGIVVSGDLSQSLGAPVKRGDVLFEVAPLDEYRIVLEVDDADIANIEPGQTGNLALSSLPHDTMPFSVSRIVPTATAEDGRNFFAVEARLDRKIPELRPGMIGIGKVSVGDRSLLWIWTHRLSTKVRLLLWKWWG